MSLHFKHIPLRIENYTLCDPNTLEHLKRNAFNTARSLATIEALFASVMPQNMTFSTLIASLLADFPESPLIEFGCGTGLGLVELCEKFRTLSVIGTRLHDHGINTLETNLAARKQILKNRFQVISTNVNTPALFDVIPKECSCFVFDCFGALSYSSNPGYTLYQALALLKPNGIFLCTGYSEKIRDAILHLPKHMICTTAEYDSVLYVKKCSAPSVGETSF